MYRKVSNIIVSVLLLVSTTGFTALKHYCGEEMISDTIQTVSDDCCNATSECCHEEAETFKIDTEYLSASNSINFEQIAMEIPVLMGPTFSNPERDTKSTSTLELSSIPHSNSEVHSYLQVFLL
jgi:hypothetical protein